MKSMYEPIEWLEKARLDLYEQTKHMTPSEFTAHINAEADRICKEFGITMKKARLQPAIPQK